MGQANRQRRLAQPELPTKNVPSVDGRPGKLDDEASLTSYTPLGLRLQIHADKYGEILSYSEKVIEMLSLSERVARHRSLRSWCVLLLAFTIALAAMPFTGMNSVAVAQDGDAV